MNVIDFLDNFVFGPLNLIDRAEGMLRLVARRDTGVRFAIKRFDKGGESSRPEARAMLKRFGVDTFGITHDATNLYFLVGSRQAKWAATLLTRAGIEHTSKATGTGGRMPAPWSETVKERRTTRKASRRQRRR